MLARCAIVVAVIGACDRSPPAPPLSEATSPKLVAPSAKLVAIDPPAARGAASPNLVATSDAVLLTWLEPTDDKRTSHRLRFARFAGGVWGPVSTITEGSDLVANWADVPSVAQQSSGVLVAHWAEKIPASEAHAYNAIVARSSDGGSSWTRLGAVHRDRTATEHGFVSLVPDGKSVLAVWLDGRAMANGATGATMLRAASIGEAIGDEHVIDERVCDCCSTSATMSADGPIVAFRDRSAEELRDPWIVRRTAGTWSPSHPVHADGWNIAGCPVNGPTIVAAGRDVVVAWYTFAKQRPTVRIAFSGDAGATFDRPIEIDATRGARSPIGRVDVVIDRAGDAIVSWVASEREDGQILARRVTRDRRLGTELEVGTIAAARDGGFPRMEASGDQLVFAWTDTRASTLRMATVPRAAVPAVGASDATRDAATTQPFPVGSKAPQYQAERLDGTAIALSALRRAPVLLNVWATWCEPCRRELPALSKLKKRHAARELQVVGISVDRDRPRDRISDALRRMGVVDLDVWHDPEDRASSAFGVSTLPTTLLFDRDGTLVWRRDGAIVEGDDALDAAIEGLSSRP